MTIINYEARVITAKIVYYGPGLSGKTTNLKVIYSKIKPENRGKLITLATQTDRTLFFDFLPVDFGEIKGYKTKFQIYTVPGQVFYNSTRKLLLKGADGIIFVADSSPSMLDENRESLKNLEENLKSYNVKITDIPIVMQYNKRDLSDAISIEALEKELNPGKLPYFEAIAINGTSVLETLSAIIKMVIHRIKASPDILANETPLEVAKASIEKTESPENKENTGEKLKKSFSLSDGGKLKIKEEELEEITKSTDELAGELEELEEELEVELEKEPDEQTSVDEIVPEKDIDKTLMEVEKLLAEENNEETADNFQIIEALPTIENNLLTIPIKLKKGKEIINLNVRVEIKNESSSGDNQ